MADVLAVRNEYRVENWSALIQECNASGLSNRQFCRQHGISEKSFYYWLRKLRHQAAEAAETHLIMFSLCALLVWHPAIRQFHTLCLERNSIESVIENFMDFLYINMM